VNLRDLWSVWQNFWFKPQSSLTISLFRILFGLVFLTQLLTQYWQDFHTFFGANPLISMDDHATYWWRKDLSANIFEFLPATDFCHVGILVLTAFFGLTMTIGFYTRFSIFACYILFCSITRQYPFFCNAGDNTQRIVLFLLMFSHAGGALSVDNFLKNRGGDWRKAFFNPPLEAPWAQRMIQVQMAIAYFSTGLIKINSEVWFAGNGVYIATRLMDFVKFPFPGLLEHALLDHKFPLLVLNIMTVAVELALGSLIWIKEFRYWVLLVGLSMHLGIDWLMNIPIFEFVFISLFTLFIEPEDLHKLGSWFRLFFKRLNEKISFVVSKVSKNE